MSNVIILNVGRPNFSCEFRLFKKYLVSSESSQETTYKTLLQLGYVTPGNVRRFFAICNTVAVGFFSAQLRK